MIGLRLGLGLQHSRPPAPEEGGGGAPEWVPESAVNHTDLVGGTPQSRAWEDGTGEVAVSTLLGTDPNTENGWGPSSYDPDFLNANGYGGVGVPDLALTGSLLSKILAGGTFRFVVHNDGPLIMIMAANGNDAIQIDVKAGESNSVEVSSWNGSLFVATDTVLTAPGTVNAFAITISGSRLEVAANGSAVATGEITEQDRPAGNPLAAILISMRSANLQSITAYDALPSTDGLSALSNV